MASANPDPLVSSEVEKRAGEKGFSTSLEANGGLGVSAFGLDHDAPLEVPWRGKFVEIRKRGRWEFAGRTRNIRAVVILALDGDDVILIDQYRVPLDRRCLELPAGLIGDEHDGDTVVDAAARELAEETGYRADRIEELGEFHSSPGMVSEGFTLVRATGLTRIGDGGGVDGEDIVVHRVPVAEVPVFVAAKRAEGLAIDVKLLILLAAEWLSGPNLPA